LEDVTDDQLRITDRRITRKSSNRKTLLVDGYIRTFFVIIQCLMNFRKIQKHV